MAASSIERSIDLDRDLDLPTDELWRLIASAEGWREWLVDEADVVVREGAVGDVVDDGVHRAVRIETVQIGRQITFLWSADDGDVAKVSLRLDEHDGRRVLLLTETRLSACAECPLRSAANEARWDLRECLLCLTARATSRV
jgi:uncharacterized protein YndB with AHSA1/START domain